MNHLYLLGIHQSPNVIGSEVSHRISLFDVIYNLETYTVCHQNKQLANCK